MLKNRIFKFCIISGLAALSISSSYAAEVIVDRGEVKSTANSPVNKNWLFFGGDLGLMSVKPDAALIEADKNGLQLHLKGLYSHYFENWVWDFGLGYLMSNISGTQPTSASNGQCFAGANCKVNTRSGFIEISPRYRINQNWQFGLVGNGLFGTDVSFDQDELIDTQSFTILAGPRLNYETDGEDGRWRFGAQIQKALNITSRSLLSFQGDIQYGFPLGGAAEPYKPVEQVVEKAPEPTPTPTPEAIVTPEPAPRAAPQFATAVGKSSVRIYLGEAVLRFKTAKWDLRPGSHEILDKVTGYLIKYPEYWEKVRIEGHTDRRGGLKYNENLSLNRAKSVARKMQDFGISRSKMVIRGYGPRKPVDHGDDAEAWAMNRRVEIWLDGVSDTATVIKDLNAMQ